MSNLKSQADAFVNAKGIPQTAAEFNVSVPSVKRWLKTGRYPTDLIEAMLNASQETATPSPKTQKASGKKPDPSDVWAHLQDHQGAIKEIKGTQSAILDTLQQLVDVVNSRGAGATPHADANGQLPALVRVDLTKSGIANLTRPSRAKGTETTEEKLNKIDPKRRKPPVDPDSLPKGHWMKPKGIGKK